MSEKEKNKENYQKKFDLQERLIDYAVRFWLPSPCLVTNTSGISPAPNYERITVAEVYNHPQGNRSVVEDNSKDKINPTFNKIVPFIAGDR